MAALSNADRVEIWAQFMRDISAVSESISVTKADLRAAFDALDNWVDANMASANTSIPQPARNNLTTSQKVRILMLVLERRFLTGV